MTSPLRGPENKVAASPPLILSGAPRGLRVRSGIWQGNPREDPLIGPCGQPASLPDRRVLAPCQIPAPPVLPRLRSTQVTVRRSADLT
jgi:hypothetical protein